MKEAISKPQSEDILKLIKNLERRMIKPARGISNSRELGKEVCDKKQAVTRGQLGIGHVATCRSS